uniref:Uncharacterized protein n=1 Tax=Anguilla anguilla TaxID=7936 RepID=A0A0E9RC61_ANGAN
MQQEAETSLSGTAVCRCVVFSEYGEGGVWCSVN